MKISEYNIVYTKLYRQLFCYTRKIVEDEPVAEDIVMETMAAVYHKFETFETANHVKYYAYICCKNKGLNWRDAQKRHRIINIADLPEEISIEHPVYDLFVIETEVLAYILEQIELMPPARRNVIKLFFKGVDSTSIAKSLGITRKTALNQKLTAIAQLKAAIKLKFHI